ncbi:hypothetical protein CIP106467_1393 [Citrobacter europaeus]|nr:hypothetical protein CIP106467_1393 [Citrobacter europaeus]
MIVDGAGNSGRIFWFVHLTLAVCILNYYIDNTLKQTLTYY